MMSKDKLRISIVGTGNVATHLAKAIADSSHALAYIVSRTLSQATHLADRFSAIGTDDISVLADTTDILILAVKDEVLSNEFLKAIPKNLILCHTSGSVSMNVLQAHPKHGIFYPLQTFSKQKELDFSNIPICLEASSKEVLSQLQNLANSISSKVIDVNSEQRKALHLAAVFACNFTNLMYDVSEKLCQESGLDFEILRPLIKETAEKVQNHKPSEVQTGPAARNDKEIIEKHLNLLSNHADYQNIYKILTDEIIQSNEEL